MARLAFSYLLLAGFGWYSGVIVPKLFLDLWATRLHKNRAAYLAHPACNWWRKDLVGPNPCAWSQAHRHSLTEEMGWHYSKKTAEA